MSEPQPWQSIVDVAILHPTHAQLLVQQKELGWTLPRVPLSQVWLVPLQQVSAEIQKALGLETTVLQKLAEVRDETKRLVYFLFLLEPQTRLWTPPAGVRWLEAAELDTVVFTQPAHRLAVATRLHERTQGVIPPLRAPNARSGWRQAAESWIESQVTALGCPLIGPVTQIKNWFLSCILCAPTTQGKIYFKASNGSPLMVNEAQITHALARLFPAHLPPPLTIEPAQDWMLLADFGLINHCKRLCFEACKSRMFCVDYWMIPERNLAVNRLCWTPTFRAWSINVALNLLIGPDIRIAELNSRS